ncbi:MAG: gamma-glutamyltransferase [Burkholderiales bacterium]
MNVKYGSALLVCAWLAVGFTTAAPAAGAAPPAGAAGAAIASAHPLATRAGEQTLAAGGNAFDAAVTVAAVLAVVEPYSSGLGGGGFWLLHRAADARDVFVDGRETAPAGVRRGDYLRADGTAVPGATTEGGTAVAIPGVPAALVHVAAGYGRLPLAQALAPAVALAREGFAVDVRYARIARLRERALREGTGTGVFLDGGRAPQPGYVLRQPALAATLERLGRDGRDSFYRGAVAEALVAAVNRAGGRWSLQDLAGYKVIERAPVVIDYRGARIVTAPPPSAGGVALVQALRMLEVFTLGDPREPETAHLVAEALRRAFRDRALYLGDPDQTPLPLAALISTPYTYALARGIDRRQATPSEQLLEAGAPRPVSGGSGNTTHFSIVDGAGNRVAATLTINLLFGAGIVAGDTGVLLNNEMDDFSLAADLPNAFRLIGGEANAIAPGRRPLSSMMPTFVEDARGVLVLGAPGGSRIVSQVLLAVLDYLRAREVDPARIVAAPRYHHQFRPDVIEIEPGGFDAAWRAALTDKGHRLQAANRRWGNLQVVFAPKDGAPIAANDPRGTDIAWY